MNLEQWQRSEKIKAEAEAAAKRTVERVLNAVKEPAMSDMHEEFEKHYLNLPFHDSKAAQKCLDSCDFDVKQNVYTPNAKWFDDNDADEGVIYCCMLNTAYMSFQHQQAKVEELQQDLEAQREEAIKGYTKISDLRLERDELQTLYTQQGINMFKLQKRVDAALKAIDSFKDYTGGDLDYTLLKIETMLKEQALKGE